MLPQQEETNTSVLQGCEADARHVERILSYLGWHYHPWALAIPHTWKPSLPSEMLAASTLVSPSSQASAKPRPLPEASLHSSTHVSSFSSELPRPFEPIPRNCGLNYIAGSVTCCCCMCIYFGSKTRLVSNHRNYVFSFCCCF